MMGSNKIYFTLTLFFMGLLGFTSCQSRVENPPVEIEINQGWEFSKAGSNSWMPANVPGTVHSDLLANDKIEDPHYRMNENDVQWIEDEDWVYRTSFEVEKNLLLASDVIELQFEGLDTYADVYLNDEKILEADNMFVGYDLDVKKYLVEGTNHLRVYFHSPVAKGMEKLNQLDYTIPAINEQAPEGERTNVFTRKAPFHYGWDWGPRLVTSGIWRPVTLVAWNKAIIDDVYVVTEEVSDNVAKLSGTVTLEAEKAGEYHLSLSIDENSTVIEKTVNLDAGTNNVSFEFEIQNPQLWWSNGLGEPYLYDFNFALSSKNQVLDYHHLNYGVRTLRLVQEPDEVGHSFYFELNGVPVFMKGGNIIPPETLTPVADKARYDRLIGNAVAANMNMVRIWGGAIYGEDYLYDLCDRNGILVWQDFMFACALQPGDEAHLENIRKEAEFNVKRLRNHPSLALWCGNNENYHGWHEWGWSEMYDPDVKEFVWNTYKTIFNEILPDAVSEFDPKTTYWPSSPLAFDGTKADRKSGDEHDWTIWFGQKPFAAYGEDLPRFVSEYGLQSFPSIHTIEAFTEEGDRDWDTEVMRHRQRGKMPYVRPDFDGNDMIRWYMDQYYNIPGDFGDFVYVSQLLQAKAYKMALEAHRRNMPHTMGSLYWQLNDSWPTISWSTVDYYGRWKAAHYAVRDANEAIIVAPVEEEGRFKVYAVNDLLSEVNGELSVRVMDFSGNEIYNEIADVTAAGNSSGLVFNENIEDMVGEADSRELVFVIEFVSGGQVVADNLYYLHRPKELKLPEAEVELSARKTEKGYQLTLSSDVLAGNVFLDTPDGNGFFTDNFFDLLPGESVVVELETSETLDPEKDISILTLNKVQ
jgi:beta-mannosidase